MSVSLENKREELKEQLRAWPLPENLVSAASLEIDVIAGLAEGLHLDLENFDIEVQLGDERFHDYPRVEIITSYQEHKSMVALTSNPDTAFSHCVRADGIMISNVRSWFESDGTHHEAL